MVEPVIIGRATLYNADCREVMAAWPECFRVAALVTDPPYGIGAGQTKTGGSKSKDWGDTHWDDVTADEALEEAIGRARVSIVWGGNYYRLPLSRGWLVWDKCFNDRWYSTAHFELAWSSMDRNGRLFRMHPLTPQAEGAKEHPAQKPLALMKWCVEQLPDDCGAIFDPFMGSGTTGVAAVQMGKSFIGIEREPKYFEIARKRIERAQQQGDMFIGEVA